MAINLITESRKWLSDSKVHWESVLYSLMDCVKIGDFLGDGVDKDKAVSEIASIIEDIHNIIDSYHKGDVRNALTETGKLLVDDFYLEIPVDTPLFRARGNETGFLYKKDEMFHIPFNKRYLVGNQRFSVSGLPCLYLGGSPYVCWEELGRPDYQKCNFSGFKTKETLFVYDFCLPHILKSLNDVRRTSLILACSIPANPKHLYKDEYILPQCILQGIIAKHYSQGTPFAEDEIYGIRYYSTHYLKGELDMFEIDDTNDEAISRMVNYIFPSISESHSGLSKYLLRAFEYTPPTSIMHLSIKDSSFSIDGSKDEYVSSSFGAIDDILRKELGIRRIREDSELLLYHMTPGK